MSETAVTDPGDERTSALVLFSGGLDSTVALAMAVRGFDRVLAVLFDYGQQSRTELRRAREIADWLQVELLVVDLDLSAWGGSTLFAGENDEEDSSDPDEGIYVPARNLIFLAVAAGIAEARDISTIWIGSNRSESTFRDNSEEFFSAVRTVYRTGLRRTGRGRELRLGTPLSALTKDAVVRAGIGALAPLHLSWSCYGDGPDPCGTCFSCRQRKQSFAAVGVADPATVVARGDGRDGCGETSLVYLLGALHSGSTVLSRMLDAHPDITAAGELLGLAVDLEQRIDCTCGLPVSICGFWARVLGPRPDLHFADVDSVRALGSHTGELADDYASEAFHVLGRIAAVSGSRVILDSSKSVARFRALAARQPVKALHLVRDGRALIRSARRAGRPYQRAAQAAEVWQRRHLEALAASSKLGVDYLLVRYEDVCAEPGSQIGRILDWMGLEDGSPSASWLDSVSHHLRGNLSRFDRRPLQLDDQWRTEVSPRDQAEFMSVAGATMARFGYS